MSSLRDVNTRADGTRSENLCLPWWHMRTRNGSSRRRVCVCCWRTASSSEGTLVKGLKRIGEVITHNAFIGIAYTYSQLLYNVTVVGRFAALDVVRPVHREKRAIL
jgi:hypothetical protein